MKLATFVDTAPAVAVVAAVAVVVADIVMAGVEVDGGKMKIEISDISLTHGVEREGKHHTINQPILMSRTYILSSNDCEAADSQLST